MAGFTDYLEEALLNHVFMQAPYTQPTTIAIGLLTSLPSDDAGTGAVEVSETGNNVDYARVSNPTWTVETDVSGLTSAQNGAIVDFGAAGTGGWGSVAGFAIYDATTAGSMLMYGEFSFPITVAEGATVTFQIGDLKVNLA